MSMDKLYHYCSIETLECILKYHTIRFSSLSQVDDMEEAITVDFDEIGRVCFVSCWTNKSSEDIAMWRTYTKGWDGKESGVRITLPCNLFDDITYQVIELKEEEFDISISPTTRDGRKFPLLFPVTYTDDDELINLSVYKENFYNCGTCNNISMTSIVETSFLGKFKRSVWSGQTEWRYRLIAIPRERYRNEDKGKYNDSTQTLENRLKLMNDDLKSVPFKSDYIDFPYNPKVLNDLEVVASPLNTEEDNNQIKALLDEYTQNIEMEHSRLKIRKTNK